MRLREVIKIDDREITVKEITVREIRSFWSEMEAIERNPGIEGSYDVMKRFLPTCVEGVEIDSLEDMAPSEINQIYEAFMRVNATFFEVARQIEGENPLLVGLRKAVLPVLMLRFYELLPLILPSSVLSTLATAIPGGTGTDSSNEP